MGQPIEVSSKPRSRKVYGHVISDLTLNLPKSNYPPKIDKRTLPHAHGMGRPYYKAIIDKRDDDLPLRYAFADAIRSCNYRELMALSRDLNVSYSTLYKWKAMDHTQAFPRNRMVAVWIVAWWKAGKPMEKIRPGIDDVRRML